MRLPLQEGTTRAQSQPCADAGAHIPRSPEAPSLLDRFSPGPWSLCCSGREVCDCVTVWTNDHPVAVCTSGDWGDEYPSLRLTGGSLNRGVEAYMARDTYGHIPEDFAKGNARLIAAAPDLLAAARIALLAFAYRGDDQTGLAGIAERDIAAAIAKATGQDTSLNTPDQQVSQPFREAE